MPKVVSDNEKRMTQEAIYQSVVRLIRKKGIKGITVDDITNEANMAKGSFYKYYSSKELCLWETVKRYEKQLMGRIEAALSELPHRKETIVKVLREVYLAEDSLVLYANYDDVAVLLRKLPPEYAAQDIDIGKNYFLRILQLLGIDEKRIRLEVLANLVGCLQHTASNGYEAAGGKETIELIINTIAEYLERGLQ